MSDLNPTKDELLAETIADGILVTQKVEARMFAAAVNSLSKILLRLDRSPVKGWDISDIQSTLDDWKRLHSDDVLEQRAVDEANDHVANDIREYQS